MAQHKRLREIIASRTKLASGREKYGRHLVFTPLTRLKN